MKTLTTTELDKLISSISNRGKKLDSDIQVAAVNAVLHGVKHNGADKLNNLIEAMPKGARVNALRDFFSVLSPFDYSEESKCFVYNKQAVKAFNETRFMSEVEEKHWTEFKPEPKYVPFDAAKELEKVAKKAIKDYLQPKTTQTLSDLQGLLKVLGYRPTEAESEAIQAKSIKAPELQTAN